MSDTARLTALDFAHLWHPFTPMRQWREATPCIIERGRGFELFDTEGGAYIDGFSSLWCNVHGHCVPEIDQAVRDQLGRIAHTTMLGHASVPAIQLAARLVALSRRSFEGCSPAISGPELNKVFFSDAGSTAVEVAFKMAIGRHYHAGERRRDTFLGISGAYHGDTAGAMSVGFSRVFHDPFKPLTFRCAWAPGPDVCHAPSETAGIQAPRGEADEAIGPGWPSWDLRRRARVLERSLTAFDRALDEIGDRCAGVVVEPIVQGAAGIIDQPCGYLAGIARRTRERGLLLIADAVAVGFGRTGTLFACEEEGVRPDILCLAKGITGGYLPLAATLCTDEIAASFEGEAHERKTLYHGHTYTGNPLACAAALASLELLERNDVLSNVRRNSAVISARLREELRDHPHVGDVRLRGVMGGIELVAAREPWTAFDPARRVGAKLCLAARTRGLLIRPLGDVVVLMPAPAMDDRTLERMLEIVVATVRDFDYSGEIPLAARASAGIH